MANQLSEYEIQRFHNIKKNHEYMKSLGEYFITSISLPKTLVLMFLKPRLHR